MATLAKWLKTAVAAGVAWLGLAGTAVDAQQVFPGPLYPSTPYYRPSVPYYIPPASGGLYGNPYAGGYNPAYVPPPVPMPPPVPGSSGSSSGSYPSSDSYGSNSYGGGGGGYGSNYYYDPWGGYLRGGADIMRAYGQLGLMQEQARIARELAIQAKIETKKKLIDLINYERANIPTYADDVKRIERLTLQRIKSTATLNEIWTGKSSNILLKDLAKHRAKRVAVEDISLPDEILRGLNVTTGFGNVGALRNNGQIYWPAALLEPSTAESRERIDKDAQKLYRQAMDAKPNNNIVRDLQIQIGDMREQLLKRANEVPTPQYIEAKRFLSDLDDAVIALRDGDAVRNAEFRAFVQGGKTIQELVKYVLEKGLTFAPAIAGDEGSYQALHSALVAHNIAVSAQLALSTKE
jgi:hypothetical protein